MLKLLRSWSAGKLFASWIAYWLLLIAIGLGPAIAAIWRVSGAAEGKGSVSASFGNTFTISVVDAGVTTYSGSIHALPLILLVAGPPLLLWVLWFASRSKRDSRQAVGQ